MYGDNYHTFKLIDFSHFNTLFSNLTFAFTVKLFNFSVNIVFQLW